MIILESSTSLNKRNVISGIGISKNSFVRTNEGFESFVEDGGDPASFCAGKYAVSYWLDRDTKAIFTDSEGQELIFYYQDSNVWACSNSFYCLCVYLKLKRVSLELDKLSLASMLVKGMPFSQPLAHHLPVKNIKVLGADEKIFISSGGMSVLKSDEHTESRSGYLENVSMFISFYRGLADSVSSLGAPINLEVSGGVDSRTLVSVFSDSQARDIGFISQRSKVADYETASAIVSTVFNKGLSPSPSAGIATIPLSLEKRYQAYVAANVGICQTVKVLPGASVVRPSFRINGGGAGLGKPVYGTSRKTHLASIKKSVLSSEAKDKVADRFIQLLDDYGGEDEEALNNLYESGRYRYFAGKAWYRDFMLCSISPFSSVLYSDVITSFDIEEFFGYSYHEIKEKGLVNLYIILNTAPQLAYFIFDKPEKSFSVDDILHIKSLPCIKENDGFRFDFYGSALSGIDFLEQDKIGEYLIDDFFPRLSGNSLRAAMCLEVRKGFNYLRELNIIELQALKSLEDNVFNDSIPSSMLVSLYNLVFIIRLAS